MDFSKQIEKAEEAVRRRNYDFAVELYQQILEIEPDEGVARAGLRGALRKRHELKGKSSGGFLRGLTGAGPLAMARTLRKAGKNDMAVKALESYLAIAPLDEDGNLLLGQVLEAAGHHRSARAVYEFLAEIAPRSAEGLKRAGALSYRLGDHAKALEYYERALAATPSSRWRSASRRRATSISRARNTSARWKATPA